MFARFSNSWQLVKASWAVLRADKELVVFPIVSMIGVIIVTIAFLVPAAALGVFDYVSSEGAEGSFPVMGIVLAFVFYVVMYFIIIFCNAALMGAAKIRLDGGDPTLGDGFRIAFQHAGAILGYAMIAATVGMILRWISEEAGTVGKIVAGILDFAWNVVTFLVVPVLVVEGVGPIEAIKRSGSLLKKTWGEQLIGNFSIGLVFGLLSLAVILVVGVPLILIGTALGTVGTVAAILVLVVLIAGLGMVGSALNGIYAVAVYRYAIEGEAGAFFDNEVVQGAFRQK